MGPDCSTRQGSRWLDFAAYVTWLGLALLGVASATGDLDLAPERRAVGLAAMGAVIGLGFAHMRARATERRLQWRWWSLGLQSALTLLAVFALEQETLAVLLIIVVSIAAESGRISATLWWLALTNLALLVILLSMKAPIGALISFALFLGFQLFAFAMNNAVTRERQIGEQLAGVNAELLATRRLLQDSARNEERLRIARGLHDVAGHRLTALQLNLRAEMRGTGHSEGRIELCHDLAHELLSDIRSVVHQLRSSSDIDVPAALALLRHQHPDLAIHLEVDPELEVDSIEVAEALVRSTQEAITNALAHGRARQVWIELVQDSRCITLTVRDDGIGGARAGSGHGLAGMNERAEILGGALVIDAAVGRGWRLQLNLPRGAVA